MQEPRTLISFGREGEANPGVVSELGSEAVWWG